MRNESLQTYINEKKVKRWMIAERLGIADSSFSRMLRYVIPKEKEIQIKQIVDELAADKDRFRWLKKY